MLELPVLLALAGAGMLAGFVDAIAGGGGLIALPALLSAGVPPVAALATNKLQGTVGTTLATFAYWRKGYINLRALVPAVIAGFAGSGLGALTVKSVDTSLLSVVVPIALIAIALYFLLSPQLSDADRASRLDFAAFVPAMAFAIGYYDGIFGPGTGSFFTMGFVTLFGLGLTRAAGHTKLLNLTSNIAALMLFIAAGDVLWPAGLAMAAGQMLGGYLGALIGIRFGARIIRPLVVLVSIILAIRLLFAA